MKRHESCSICKQIPNESYAFWSGMGESGNLPKEESQLEVVGAPFFQESTSHRQTLLKKCPQCGTFYQWRFDYEFLIPTSENEITLTRLDDNEGARRETEVLQTVRAAGERFRAGAAPHLKALRARSDKQAMYFAADYLMTGQLNSHDVTFALPDAARALKWLYQNDPESRAINTLHILFHPVPDDSAAAREALRLLRKAATVSDRADYILEDWEKEFGGA